MKRPPGLWILLSAGVLWLSLQDVYGIRATALIFGKSSTSTTTTESPADGVSPSETSDEETVTSAPTSSDSNSNSTSNSTKPKLTGIPQIDYVWDPNLPQELNSYNLSEYPFYERVPDEVIEFKCDGLHDGFYASIPHKCQVYHQCLFGTRYDFLCANYTAFDQKTFICQFVSVVDCVNSKKFWHRNDALYQTQSTTTSAPLNLKAAIYTTAPPDGGDPLTPRKTQGAARRRPTRRRRPQIEYYDDEYYDDEEYYEERPRANRDRKRPRPRPRPVYEDEQDYEEYDDERYESRRTNTRRRPSRRRNKDRKKPDYEDAEDAEVDDKFEDEDYLPAPKRPRPDDRRKETDEDEGSTRKRPSSEKRRPPAEKREQSSDRKPPRKSNRRPAYDEEYEEDELPQSDDSRSYEDRPRKKQNGQKEEASSSDGRPIIKSSTGTIYDRPRVAPRINLPVPKNAADKFAYTSKSLGGSTTTPKPEEDYEEYEEAVPKRSTNRRPAKESKKPKNEDSKSHPSGSRLRTRIPESEEVVEKSTTTPKPKYTQRNKYRPSTSTKKPAPVSQEYEEEEYLDEEVEEHRPILKTGKKTTTTTTTTSTSTTTTEAPRKEPVMRIIKRPFLPSRGGSPYSSRGLQPIGLKAVEKPTPEIDSEEYIDEEKDSDYAQVEEEKFKPSPVLIKVPVRPKYTEAQELIDLEPSRQQTFKARTTQRPKLAEKNPLDLNEYDVTLNDALNPTLPNLPVRAFPTGFSSGSDYNNGYQRTRYVMEPNQNYLYNNKVAKSPQRYEAVPQGQYSTLNAGYRQPQAQTQALYSGY